LADPVTFSFFQAAIAEGADQIIPGRLRSFKDREVRWKRMRDAALAYFSSMVILEEVAKNYFGNDHRQSAHQHLRRF